MYSVVAKCMQVCVYIVPRCVCMHLCTYIYVGVCMCMHMNVEARVRQKASFLPRVPATLLFWFETRSFTGLELTKEAKLVPSRGVDGTFWSPCAKIPEHATTPGFFLRITLSFFHGNSGD